MGIFTTLASFAFGVLTQVFSLFTSQLKDGAKMLIKFHQEGISYARSVGMSLKESQAYTNTLIARTEVLARKYGVAAEQIAAVQKNLSDATGRALMLGDIEAERMVQINKLVGEATNKAFMTEIMQHMGGQLSTAQGAVSKAYATAAKRGLDAANFSAKVAQNLTLANKLSFRNGVDGIIKMTALSEKLGFNLQSIERAANNFMDLDKAIENSARLQMLGGSAGVYGSNPLAMSYEANYDPEAFTERMTKTLSGLATFDKKTGMANVNGMNRDFVKNIADAMGIGFEEAMSIAKKSAEVNYKERAYAPARAKYTEDEWDFIMNKSHVDSKTGKLMMTDSSGQEHDISKGMDKTLIAEMMKYDGMDEKALMESQARDLSSINEELKGIGDSILASFAKALQPILDLFMPQMDNLGNIFMKIAKPLAEAIPHILTPIAEAITKAIPKISAWFDENGNQITEKVVAFAKDAKEGIKSFIDVMKKISEYGGLIVTALGVLGGLWLGKQIWQVGKTVFDFGKTISNFFKGRPSASPSASTPSGVAPSNARPTSTATSSPRPASPTPTKSFGSKLKNVSGVSRFQSVKSAYGQNRASGLGRMKSFSGALKNAGSLGRVAKVGGGIGVALSLSQGVSSISDYSDKKNELQNMLGSGAISKQEYEAEVNQARIEKNEGVGGAIGAGIGTALGTAIGGPIGAVIGGFLGDKVGGFIGKHWDTVTEIASSTWNATKDFARASWDVATSAASAVWGGVANAASAVWGGISSVASDVWSGIRNVASDTWDGMKNVASNVWGGIKTVGSDVIGAVGKVANGAIETYSKAMSAIGSVAKGAISATYNGAKTLVKDVYGGVRSVVSDVTNGAASLFKPKNDVKAKPIGEKEYIYVPKSSETYSVNGNTVTVKDFNVKIDGTIRLDAGNYIKNLDVKALLDDHAFVSSLKTMIKDSINADINNGRVMNDVSTLRGNTHPTTIWGRRS